MIIAIDETGDFSPNSELSSFFVAILIDQSNNGLEVKKQQFETWKKTILEHKFNEKGEIKGSDLDDNELLSFVKNVYNAKPVLRREVVFFLPKENPESLMKKFKGIEVEKLNKVSEILKSRGKFEMAKQYERMAIWHKNAKKMHYPHFFKLILLRNIISKALNTTIGVSFLLELLHDKESKNLLNIRIKIDQDFVRGADSTIYWKELLRNSFIISTIENPLPLLDTSKNGHPFMGKYKKLPDNSLDFTDLFKNNCDFLESHEHFEIQLADITGIIINRYHNRNRAIDAYNELFKVIKNNTLTKLILDSEPNFDTNPIIIE